MNRRVVSGIISGAVCLLVTATSRAQCTKDTECKGSRVCEAGACVEPSPISSSSGAPAPAPQPAPAAAPAPAPTTAPTAAASATPPPVAVPAAPAMQRHSRGMMVGGIVMLSFVPVALLVGMIASLDKSICQTDGLYDSTGQGPNCGRFDAAIYGSLVVGGGLLAGGIPLVVVGGKKEPVTSARIAPWATPSGAGLGLRLEL